MILQFYLILSLLIPSLSRADGPDYAQAATSFAEKIKEYEPRSASGVPGFVGIHVPETHYNEKTMESAKYQAAAKSEAFKMVKDSIDQRQPYDLDVVTDPIFKRANDILEKSESPDSVDSPQEGLKKSLHHCTRGQTQYESKCKRILIPHQVGTRQEEKTYTINLNGLSLYKSGQMRVLCNQHPRHKLPSNHPSVIAAFKSVFNGVDAASGQKSELNLEAITSVNYSRSHGGQVQYFYEKSRRSSSEVIGMKFIEFQVTTKVDIPIFELVWQEDCKTLESLIDQGDCEVVAHHCVSGPLTKTIRGATLTAECWEEDLIYRCHGNQHNSCKPLLEKGCIQVSSTCKTREGDHCLEWEQTFECYEGNQCPAKLHLTGEKPFCLEGDCVDQSWAPNQDMADSLSKLAIFRDMHKTMDPKTQKVFKGDAYQCSRQPASYKNCCVQKGWGMKLGLAHCSETEKKLAEQRQANKCIQVGTYCAKKEFGICTKKKTSFCCYPTKLARIIHQQGGAQLGLSFGSPQHPSCDRLTLSDFVKIDFSKIDFSELFEDILNKTNLPNPQPIAQGIQRSLEDGSRLITDKHTKITQGRSNDSF